MISVVSINDVEYEVEESVALNDKATEELDSITFNIANVNTIDLEPFQVVVIVFKDRSSKRFVVNTWVDEVASFNGLKNYTINCISETKMLERVQLPNMTITQPLGLEDSEKRTYDRYLNKALVYINKVYHDMIYSDRLLEKMSGIIAVEEQFNTPNAKEYINQLLEKINAIVVVKNGIIDYFDLSSEGNEIDSSKILFTNTAQTIEDYYSDIVTDVQGVQSEDATIITELVGVRSPENAVVTYDNAVVQLSHNINFLKEVAVICKLTSSAIGGEDIVQKYYIYGEKSDYNFIKEKSMYDLLLIDNRINDDFDYDINRKRLNLYYTRGQNTIEGLNYTEKSWFVNLSDTMTAIEYIIKYYNIKNYDNGGALLDYGFNGDIRDLKFEVTYSAIDDVSTKFEKDKTTKSQIRDNQSDSYVDLDKFAKAQQEKLNRLGNETMEINARYYSLSDIPDLMDTIGDYVLAEREIIYHRDYIDFKGVLYKDYVKKNVFYGVNAKRRTTQLITGSDAVTRKDITKLVYNFGYSDTSDDKSNQRYFLGKIVASNLVVDDTLPFILQGAWYFNDIINTSGGFYIENEESVVIYGTFYYGVLEEYLTEISRIDIEYNEGNSTYLMYYWETGAEERTLVFDGLNWASGVYKRLEVKEISYLSATKETAFHTYLKENATKVKSFLYPVETNEYNMTDYDFKPIQLVGCTSHFEDNTTTSYKLEPDIRKANIGVTINLKWYDNINVGMQLDGIKTTSIIDLIQSKGGYEQKYVPYTDDNGEVESLTLTLYDRYDYNPNVDNYEYVDKYPKFSLEYTKDYYSLLPITTKINKDNREILNHTIQIDFVSEDGIYITDRFVDMLPFFLKRKEHLYIWTSSSRYNKYNYNKVLSDAVMQVDDLKIDYTDFIDFVQNNNAFNRIKLYNNNISMTNVNSWAIADAEGNVYIAVNTKRKVNGKTDVIYLNKKGE